LEKLFVDIKSDTMDLIKIEKIKERYSILPKIEYGINTRYPLYFYPI